MRSSWVHSRSTDSSSSRPPFIRPPGFLSLGQVAQVLGTTPRGVMQRIRRGGLAAIPHNGVHLVSELDLASYVAEA